MSDRAPEPPKEEGNEAMADREDSRTVHNSGSASGDLGGVDDSLVEARVPHEPPAVERLQQWLNKVRRWRAEDDRGYDEATDLLCEADEHLSVLFTQMLTTSCPQCGQPWYDHLWQPNTFVCRPQAQEARAAQPLDWHPIATAPKDKESDWVLVALIDNFGTIFRVSEAKFNGLGWYDKAGKACHWRTHWCRMPPLPDPPAAVPQAAQE